MQVEGESAVVAETMPEQSESPEHCDPLCHEVSAWEGGYPKIQQRRRRRRVSGIPLYVQVGPSVDISQAQTPSSPTTTAAMDTDAPPLWVSPSRTSSHVWSEGPQTAQPQEPDIEPRRPVSPTLSEESNVVLGPNRRSRYLAFVKILFKCLDQANQPALKESAKNVVLECTRRNRMGDPAFTPLMEALDQRLRPVVGEMHWRRATFLLRRLMVTVATKQLAWTHAPPMPLEL